MTVKRVTAAIVLGSAVSACTTLLGLTPVPDLGEGGTGSADTMTDGPNDSTAADSSGDSGSSFSDAGADGTLGDDAPVSFDDTPVDFGDGGNLIQNPSCENGTSPWTTLGDTPLASSSKFVHSGDTASCWSYDRHDVETMGEPVSYDGPLQDITSVVVPGHLYNASVWVLWAPPLDAAPGGTYEPQTVKLTVRYTCGPQTMANYPYSQWAVDTPEETWVHVVMQPDIVVPVGCEPLAIQLYVEGVDLGLDLYVDEMTLVLVN